MFQFPLFQNLTEKVTQHSDSTYSAVKGLGYDETNNKLGLVISQGGADTVIPFSSGGSIDVINYMRDTASQANLYYTDPNGVTTISTATTSSGVIVDDALLKAEIKRRSQDGNYYVYITPKVAGVIISAYINTTNSSGSLARTPVTATSGETQISLFYHSTATICSGAITFIPD